MLKIFVLGHKGMLGHVVTRYLREKGFEVITTDKRFEASHDCQLLREVSLSRADVIINCIGKIRQKTCDQSELFLANTVLPIQILQKLEANQKFIQVSSDCVFSGHKNIPYEVSDEPDPTDTYGASKAAGEIVAFDPRVIVLRTSIIGPELNSSFGLFAWFVNNASSTLSGYENHLWNGVTTLQFAKVIECILCSTLFNLLSGGVSHVISQDPISKHKLLCIINDIWSLNKRVNSVMTPYDVNHVLRENVSSLSRLSIEQQLKELKDWY